MKRTISVLTVVLVLGVLSAVYWAVGSTSLGTLYNRGNRLYEEGNYSDATAVYNELISSGAFDGYLFYNLGNSYFKGGEIGRAILWYSRAKKLLPRDNDIITNLEFARKVRADKIEDVHLTAVSRVLRAIVLGLNLNELILATFAVYVLAVASLITMIWSRKPFLRRITNRTSLVLAVLLSLCLCWVGGRIYYTNHTVECVLMVPQVDAMSGPGDEYTEVMSLHEGAEAQIEESREGWYLVKLPNGLGGWIPHEAVEVVALSTKYNN